MNSNASIYLESESDLLAWDAHMLTRAVFPGNVYADCHQLFIRVMAVERKQLLCLAVFVCKVRRGCFLII